MSSPSAAARRVLVTRAAHQAGKLSQALRAVGLEPVEVPVLEIQPPDSFWPLDQALRELSSFDWLILTSTNAVKSLAERGTALGVSFGWGSFPKVVAVGEATAKAAREAGLSVTIVPESYVAEGLVTALGNQVAGCRVLLARAAVARDVIPDALRAQGAVVEVVEAYKNAMPKTAPEQLQKAMEQGIAVVTFTSSSSVTHLKDAVKAAGLAWPLPGVAAVSIGPITSQTLKDSGWLPAAEAAPYDIPGLIEAVERVMCDVERSDM